MKSIKYIECTRDHQKTRPTNKLKKNTCIHHIFGKEHMRQYEKFVVSLLCSISIECYVVLGLSPINIIIIEYRHCYQVTHRCVVDNDRTISNAMDELCL